MRRIITLTTDFGTVDGYVGEMKGVLYSLAPDAEIVDITHDIPPQDVERGRLTLARVWRRYPSGTVHLAVVDPGVGSTRAGLAVESDGRFLVGPDNGVLSPALIVPGARVVELHVPPPASKTFHGRDVFAPAAAALARGESLDGFAPAAAPIVRRTPEATRRADGGVDGEVILIDRFGNAVTNLIARPGAAIVAGANTFAVRRTYAEAAIGEPLALVGSSGFVEIAVRDGSAAAVLGIARGQRVTLMKSSGASDGCGKQARAAGQRTTYVRLTEGLPGPLPVTMRPRYMAPLLGATAPVP